MGLGLLLVALNVALLALTTRRLVAWGREQWAPALPHWPESLDLPVPQPGRRRSPA